MEVDEARQVARRLHEAMTTKRPVPPITEEHPGLSADDAYLIQSELVAMLGGAGEVVGYKLGLTSKPMQAMLGVDQPDHSPVLSTMVIAEGDTVPAARFIQPKIEAEIALRLARDLSGPGATVADAGAAVGGAMLAIEIIDSRIEGWRIGLADTIADVASCGAVVVSGAAVPLDRVDPRLIGVVVTRNGALQATGAGAAALGDPLEALAWLANTLAGYGQRLRAGWFVMTGSLHAAFPFEAGDAIVAETDALGSLKLNIG